MSETDKPDADPVHDRVDQVIQDMTAGRVIPRKVDELSTAVDRAKRDQAVHRVTSTTQVRTVSKTGMSTLLRVTQAEAEPTRELKNLMAGAGHT